MLALQLVRRDSVYRTDVSFGLKWKLWENLPFLVQGDVRELVRHANKQWHKKKPNVKLNLCAGLDFLTYKGGLCLNWNDWILCGFYGAIKSTLVCPNSVSTTAKHQGWKPGPWIQLYQRSCNPNFSVNTCDIQSFTAHVRSCARCCFHMYSHTECCQWQHKKVKVLAAAEPKNRCDPNTRGKPLPDSIIITS